MEAKYSNFIEHPEGGRYQEVFRSVKTVFTVDKRSRSALTHIYFSLKEKEVSRFHRVKNDEVWNLYQGHGLELFLWDGVGYQVKRVELSSESMNFCHVVHAGCWQAARAIMGSVLVGCSVAPGFEFDDFELIRPDSEEATYLRSLNEGLGFFV